MVARDFIDDPTGSAQRASAVGAPRIGVIYNPRSHRNRALQLEIAAFPGVEVAAPERRADLRAVLQRFAESGIECLVISGGDGTVRDVLTAGLPLFGEHWPQLAVIPAGKTNALAFDLGTPRNWSLGDIVSALGRSGRAIRRPLVVRDLDGGGMLAGFVFGAGVFTTAVATGQDAHRLGAFNSLAVAATAAWGAVQILLGSKRNRWRRGVEMDIRTGPDRVPLPRSRWGDPARRMFVLAAALDRLPANVRPYGSLKGQRIFAIDYPRRRVFAAAPAIVAGWESDWLARNGFNRCASDRIEISLADRFILDGEAFPAGRYVIEPGPALSFVVP